MGVLLNKVQYLRGCIQTVLPAVFTDDLSYMEMLAKTIDKLNETIGNVNVLSDYYNSLDGLLEQITSELNSLKDEVVNFEQQINSQFRDLENDINTKFANQQAETNAKFEQLKTQLETEITNFETWARDYIKEAVDAQQEYLNLQIAEIHKEIEENNNQLKNYLDAKLEEFQEMIPEWQNVNVVNPFTGELDSLQNVIDQIYETMRFEGLTAYEYDSLRLTAAEYDKYMVNNIKKGLTAFQYDFYGRRYLWKDPNLYMLYPYGGEKVFYKQVVDFNTGLLRESGSFSAEQYDSQQFTAEYYDNKQVTANQYDWKGNRLLTA